MITCVEELEEKVEEKKKKKKIPCSIFPVEDYPDTENMWEYQIGFYSVNNR